MLTTKNVDRSKLTTMLLEYAKVKDDFPNDIVLYRVGDFFEAYFEDAVEYSTICGITFTGKTVGSKKSEKEVNLYSNELQKYTTDDILRSTSLVPMAGVPRKALNQYVQMIINAGKRVVLVEQLEDRKKVNDNRNLKRGVVCILSNMDKDGEFLAEYLNNWICTIYRSKNKYSVCFIDAMTSDAFATTVDSVEEVLNEISRYKPSEVVVNNELNMVFSDLIQNNLKLKVMMTIDEEVYSFNPSLVYQKICKSCNVNSIDELHYNNLEELCALLILISYIEETKKVEFSFGKPPVFYTFENVMSIDAYSRANLELTENKVDRTRSNTLISVLDKCKTSMGSRKLKLWIDNPLLSKSRIEKRLDAVTELMSDRAKLEEIRECFVGILDISRIMGRLKYNKAIPKELVGLRESLRRLPNLRNNISDLSCSMLSDLYKNMSTYDALCYLLDKAILDNPASDIQEGLVIKQGYNVDLDTARDMIENSNKYLAELEERERERTGIKTLKVVNKNGKCAIEVTKNNLDKVPSDYRIDKPLKGCTRYVTDESEKLEKDLYSAIEQSKSIEIELYEEIKKAVLNEYESITTLCDILSTLDVLCSLSIVSLNNGYNRPTINDKGFILIQDGRHPVVESAQGFFVENDTTMDIKDNKFLVITGPNMAGKSTYMRQVALIVIMAHIGCFVPATLADIALTDKIFTRIGASDDISSGRSTYMVEMTEVKNILNNATRNSLVILDEVGRGTSLFDGLSIAQAVSEYIYNEIGCKTLFATHYHELIALEQQLSGLKNYHMAVEKEKDGLNFIRKLIRGGMSDSYGIDVAEMAGIPKQVVDRAWEILNSLEKDKKIEVLGSVNGANDEILDMLKGIDKAILTPSNAYYYLYQILDKLK